MLQRTSVRFLAALTLTVTATAGLTALAAPATDAPATAVVADSQWGAAVSSGVAPAVPGTAADSQWG
ncbi:hypothetical protein [Streptomyces sp. NPDC005435]|uniref:hypothetical protein n=1 Tax=Streptomyces sp. NPDC005435 TaxID=3154464 RepID=UPI003453D741